MAPTITKYLLPALLSCLPLVAQSISLRAVPIPMNLGSAVIGPGEEAGVWILEACSETPQKAAWERERLVRAFPQLRPLPEALVTRLLGAREAKSPYRRASFWLSAAAYVGGLGVTTYGVVRNDAGATSLGVGAVLLPVLLQQLLPKAAEEAARRAPSYALPDPLPASIVLNPLECGSWTFLAPKIKGAQTLGPTRIN